MIERFSSFYNLTENSLYSTAVDKDAFIKDKSRVAHALLFNFFGTLGMINGSQPAQRQTLLNFLRNDKQLRIDKIDDTNLDISLSVKLAYDAGFFINTATVNEITRFLVKLKQGQITNIDSLIIGRWAAALKPDFITSIKDPTLRQAFIQFKADGGKTIDVSRLAVEFKTRVTAVPDGGEFKTFAVRFGALTDTSSAPPAASATPAAPVKLSYYQRQKLKKQQAAAGVTPATPTPAVATPAAPAKLSYYQKQKLKKQQAAAQAAADLKATLQAAQAALELKAKEEEENKKAAAAAVKSMPKEHLDKMINELFKSGAYPSTYVYADLAGVKRMFSFDIVPDVYAKVADRLHVVATNMNTMFSTLDDSSLTQAGKATEAALKEISKITGHQTSFVDMVKYVIGLNFNSAKGGYGGRYVAVLLMSGEPITAELYDQTVYQLAPDGMRNLCQVLADKPNLMKQLGEVAAGKEEYFRKLCVEGYPVFSSMRVSKSYGQAKTYAALYANPGYDEYAYQALIAYSQPFSKVIDYVLLNAGSYGVSTFEETFVAFGVNDTTITKMQGNLQNALQMRFKEFFDTNLADSKYATVVRRLLRSTLAGGASVYVYDPSARDGGGPLLQQLHNMFAKDLVDNGWGKSKIREVSGAGFTDYSVKYMLKVIGVDADELVKNHPNDPASTYIKVTKDGLHSVDTDKLAQLILTADPGTTNITGITRATRNIMNNASGDREVNCNAITKATLMIAQSQPTVFDNQTAGQELLNMLPYTDGDTVNGWLRFAKQNNNKWIMGVDLYKNIEKSRKQEYVDVLTGIVQDSIGSDIEDYVNDIVESLPPHVIQKMRGNLVGGAVLIDEIAKGEIKPFDKIDSARLKKIFLYNDIDMSALLTGAVDKKKKSETYVQYFARAKQTMKDKQLLQQAKVKEDKQANAKAINKIMIQRDHAGKHGDTYPKIDKVYDANLEYPEFWQFRKQKPQDGSVVPAYHGTGGIAAGMILRYGFKVIKSSDPSVVGRMLGDGIYFSNKIDKVSQYVSNGGYSRQHGQKGYVMEMDTNLGIRNRDYRAAGIDGRDNIRSPEWCVVDPKAQLRITRVYEVTLVSKSTVDKHLNEDVQLNGLKGFKQHLKEQVVQENGNVTSFVFRDGMIPIVDQDGAITYVDFEEALSKKLIKEDMFDVSAQGPVIVFRGTPDQVVVDERYAHHMTGNELQLYIQLFRQEMSRM